MNRDDAEEFTESLGYVVAGSWRLIHQAERLGIPKALGMPLREWVEDRLGGYVRLTIPQRREAVAEMEAQGMSTRQVADVLGVSHTTVERDLGPDVPDSPDDDLGAGPDVPPKQPKCKHCRVHGCP